MKKLIMIGLITVLVLAAIPAVAVAGGNGAYKGEAADPDYPQLGTIKYLANKPGYHFWFTVNADLGPYVAGHSYHNVYKFEVGDPGEWADPVTIPDREPYNLVGPVGAQVYYKIFDTTTDTQVMP